MQYAACPTQGRPPPCRTQRSPISLLQPVRARARALSLSDLPSSPFTTHTRRSSHCKLGAMETGASQCSAEAGKDTGYLRRAVMACSRLNPIPVKASIAAAGTSLPPGTPPACAAEDAAAPVEAPAPALSTSMASPVSSPSMPMRSAQRKKKKWHRVSRHTGAAEHSQVFRRVCLGD